MRFGSIQPNLLCGQPRRESRVFLPGLYRLYLRGRPLLLRHHIRFVVCGCIGRIALLFRLSVWRDTADLRRRLLRSRFRIMPFLSRGLRSLFRLWRWNLRRE